MVNIETHLNEHNRPLFEKLLQTGYKFNFKTKSSNQAWSMKRSLGEIKVYCITSTSKTPHPEQLTHELLHLWLETQGYIHYEEMELHLFPYLIYELIKIICPCDKRKPLASNDCYVEFDNMLAHVRMFEEYVGLGFDKTEFLYTKPCIIEKQNQYKFKIEDFDEKKICFLIMDFWNLKMIKKMGTLNAQEIETLEGLLQERSHPWFKFSEMMYKLWREDFRGIDNIGFYKRLVSEYDMLHTKLKVIPREESNLDFLIK